MFHKLFRLLGRRDRATAAEIEEEALMAVDDLDFGFAPTDTAPRAADSLGPGFDCAEDVKFLP